MKFKDINVGDEVFVEVGVSCQFNKVKNFWIPVKVERITKTQFTAEGKRYLKDTGRRVGGGYSDYAYLKGEADYWGKGKVYDQTEEHRLYKERVILYTQVNHLKDRLFIDLDSPVLPEICDLLKKVNDLNSLRKN